MTTPVRAGRVGAALGLLGAGSVGLGRVRGGLPAACGLVALAKLKVNLLPDPS